MLRKSADNIHKNIWNLDLYHDLLIKQCSYVCYSKKKTFSNGGIKPVKMKDHLERIHSDKKNKNLDLFQVLKEKFRNQSNLKKIFKTSAITNNKGELKAVSPLM